MDFTNDRECIIFEDCELLPAPTKRGRLFVISKIIIWCVCLMVAAAMCVAGVGLVGAADRPDNGAHVGGDSGGEETRSAPPQEESSEESVTRDSEAEELESDGEDEGLVTEPTEEFESEKSENFVSVDLSFSEKGDGYLYNYSKHEPDAEGLLDMGFNGGRSYYSEKPVVLILHTYISEGYYDLDPDSPSDALSKSVISVGERIAYDLNRNGVPTVHATVIHGDNGKGAYADAAETIRHMLEIYPTIEYVIDLRRMEDADEEGRALRTESALGTAQIRLTVSSKGYLEQENLALALALRRELNLDGKALCMPVVYTDATLNAGITPYYLRVDVGANGNLTSEALEAGKYFAEVFSDILKK